MGGPLVRSAAAAVAAASLVACGPADERASALAAAVDGLCRARDAAAARDIGAADATFQDRSHAELHRLVERVQDRDRAAAAAVLEAMERVESGLRDAGDPADVAAALEQLLTATRGAAAELETEVPEC